MHDNYSWQVRSIDCFAKTIDKSLLKEDTTGVPQDTALIFLGRLLVEEEEVYIDSVADELTISCRIRRYKSRHRLFMLGFKEFLKSKGLHVGDLLLFDRSMSVTSKFLIFAYLTTVHLLFLR